MKKVFYGNIITAEEDAMSAEAVVAEDGKIIYVGSRDEAENYLDEGTEIIDYKDNFIYPGFIESHCHGFFAGYRSIGQIDLSACLGDYSTYIPVIKEYMAKYPDKEFYIAAGWNEVYGSLDHQYLEDICSDKPFVLNTTGGHSCLLNQKAMEMFSIDREAVKKHGRALVHAYENGEPTGYVCEEVAVKILSTLPVKFEDAKNYILGWQDTALSKGYTACCDAGTELMFKDANRAYHELEQENKLKLRTYAFSLVADNVENPQAAIEKIDEIKANYDGEYFTTIGAKAFLDGVAEARTSWMLDEYKDEPGYYGVKRFCSEDKMVELLTEASRHGLSVHVHSEGNGATGFMLKCIRKSQESTHNLDQRNLIAHLHFVKEEDFRNMAETGSVALVAPLWTPKFPGAFERETGTFGIETTAYAYPIKSFIDAGAVVTFHTDYPISPILDVSRSFYMAENRNLPEEKQMGLSDTQNNIKEAISRIESLKAMTINAAYALKQEERMGSIKEGKLANFVVMDKNLLADDAVEIIKAKTLATIIDGNVVYESCGCV